MSYYLCFKKGGVQIYNTRQATTLYNIFFNAPWDKWKPMTKEDFENAHYNLEEKKEYIEDKIDIYNHMFESSREWEERWDSLEMIKDLKKDLEQVEIAKIQLSMLEEIFEEGKYAETEEEKATYGLEWGVF